MCLHACVPVYVLCVRTCVCMPCHAHACVPCVQCVGMLRHAHACVPCVCIMHAYACYAMHMHACLCMYYVYVRVYVCHAMHMHACLCTSDACVHTCVCMLHRAHACMQPTCFLCNGTHALQMHTLKQSPNFANPSVFSLFLHNKEHLGLGFGAMVEIWRRHNPSSDFRRSPGSRRRTRIRVSVHKLVPNSCTASLPRSIQISIYHIYLDWRYALYILAFVRGAVRTLKARNLLKYRRGHMHRCICMHDVPSSLVSLQIAPQSNREVCNALHLHLHRHMRMRAIDRHAIRSAAS
jgi:hypothetical protein